MSKNESPQHIVPPVINSELKYRGKRLSLRNDFVDCGLDDLVCREVVEHPGAVVILPLLENGHVLMIEQYRHPLGSIMLEFPAGTLEENEDPAACARRELQEEAHMLASEIESLGVLHPAPGFCDEVQYLFIARGLVHEQGNPDPGEIIVPREMEVGNVRDAVLHGVITDAKSIAVFYRAELKGYV
jgi:ADP-ribose pyrophosphatase